MHPFLDHAGPLAIAHRGGALDGRENTMAAFARAVALGYRYLETDVHTTADGVLVAFHDAALDRVTDRTGKVAELPWRELRKARVGGSEPIPLLVELLERWPHVRVNIDPKSDAAVQPLIEVIQRTGAIDRVCVGSFSDRRLQRMRVALGPRLCTSMGPHEVFRLRLASWGEAAKTHHLPDLGCGLRSDPYTPRADHPGGTTAAPICACSWAPRPRMDRQRSQSNAATARPWSRWHRH